MIDNRLKKEKFRGGATEKKTEGKKKQSGESYKGANKGKARESVKDADKNRGWGKQKESKEDFKRPKSKGVSAKDNRLVKQKDQNNKDQKAKNEEQKLKERKAVQTIEFRKRLRKGTEKCPVFLKCGGCQFLDISYEEQLAHKQKKLEDLLKPYCFVEPIIGMKEPCYYRNKVHAVFDHDKKGNPVSGVYEQNSHRVVPIETCMIEDQKADEIIGTIRGMLKSFKIRTYDEDTGYGLLRHVLIRRGFTTGEIMVVLVTSSPIFPSKNNFVKALRQKHPEITTIIQNINGRDTSMVLGNKEHVLYGKGYIEDLLCGYRFRISSKSFYQINPVQTEILYKKAMEAAGLKGRERVIDAYCGIGTIGIVASSHAKEVIGVELNRDAVRDAVENAKINGVKNIKFFCNDAGKFMVKMAESGERADVVFMDPPRTGSSEEFIDSVAKLGPEKVVYVSCGPDSLVRDLEVFRKKGYEARKGWGVDLFPFTNHVETVVLLERKA